MGKLDQRTVLVLLTTNDFFYEEVDLDPKNQVFEPAPHQTFVSTEIEEHQRTYQKVENNGTTIRFCNSFSHRTV